MRPARTLAGPLLVLLLIAGCGRAPELDRLAAGETGKVAEVTSGHALTLEDGLQVRLAGVEAPRSGDPHGEESETALARLAEGQSVRLYYGGRRRDDYDRALAQVKLTKGGDWLQKALLKTGAARVRLYPDNLALAEAMLEAEASARNRKRGLWALPAYAVLSPAEAGDAYGFQLVEGTVRTVEDAGEGRRLRFDDGFDAYVPGRAIRAFEASGRGKAMIGRYVRLRGVIRDGQMQLDAPEQVELLKVN